MPTVADLLKAPTPAPSAPSAPVAPIPDGFVPDEAISPPPAGFVVQQAAPKASFVKDLLRPGADALNALQSDFGKSVTAMKNPNAGPVDFLGAQGAMLKDAGALALSPITGAANALVVQPGARLADQIPLTAYTDPKLSLEGGLHIEAPRPMSPEERHAANVDAISTALMALGPKGFKGGATTEGAAAHYAGKVADVVGKVPPEVALDEKGVLTPEGEEAAVRAAVHPEDLEAAYKAVKETPPPEMAQEAPPAAEAPQAQPSPEPPPAAGAEPASPMPEAPEAPLPQAAADRLAQAASEGVDLTRGQGLQNFETQVKEQDLQGQAGPDAAAARQFFARQQAQIAGAVDRFKSAIGSENMTAVERGDVVKGALTQLRDSGRAGVSALYRQARDLVEGLGGENSNLGRLETRSLIDAMRGIMIDEAVPTGVRSAVRQQAAQYGLIGGEPRVFEDGTAAVKVRDAAGEEGPSITLPRPPQPLTVANAEDLRQAFNRIYDENRSAAVLKLKPVLDEAVQAAVEEAIAAGHEDIGQAFKAARGAHQTQQQTFKAGDVVQRLIDWKRGTSTPTVLPEHALREVVRGGKEAVTELRKIKAVLLSTPTDKSRAAWQAIQAHAVADIFDKAMVLNARMDGGELGTISGAKLNTAISKFGVDKLKVVLSESDFNQLMKLRRIIGDATIPIRNSTNPSGSGYAVMRFLGQQGLKLAGAARFVPGVGHVVDAARGLYTIGKRTADARTTLKGIEGFDAEAAAKADAPKTEPAEYARQFIRVAGSDEILAPLVASAANDHQH